MVGLLDSESVSSAKNSSQGLLDLSQAVLFNGVPEGLLSRYLDRCEQVFFRHGEVLISPHENNSYMYVLLTGSVYVCLESVENQPLVKLGPGECVGEMSLFDGRSPSAFVLADQDAATLAIDSALLWNMINESHEIARNLLFMLSSRIRTGNAAVNYTQALHKKTLQAAESDALTGVNNRRWLEALMLRLKGRSVEELAPLSLIMMDVDHFKRFNDQYGHQTGDEVLRMVAGAMQDSLRPNDMVARYGGEEFLILLPKTKISHALHIAERLREKISSTRLKRGDAEGDIPTVTVSLGVAQWQQGLSIEALIELADAALYQAKNSGRNRVCRSNEAI